MNIRTYIYSFSSFAIFELILFDHYNIFKNSIYLLLRFISSPEYHHAASTLNASIGAITLEHLIHTG